MRTGNLADLVALPGMPSGPSMERFIASRPDFPLIERGSQGRAYVIDLDAAAAFVRAHWRDQRHKRRDACPTLPDLFGADHASPDR